MLEFQKPNLEELVEKQPNLEELVEKQAETARTNGEDGSHDGEDAEAELGSDGEEQRLGQ